MTGGTAHKIAFINGQLYIKVMSPIRDKNKDKIIGHFEGVYHVSDDKMVEIKNKTLLSAFQSVLIVLATTFLLYPVILQLKKKLLIRSYELLDSNINTIKSLGSAIAKRDSDTNSHNYRVTIYSVRLAEKLRLSKSQIQALIKGAFLHDIGKIGISDAILLKPGKLTHDEFEIVKQHVVLGVEILENNKWLKDAIDVVLYHHEKFDGSGYIHGLKDKNIPVNAKIFAIVDVFDALTSSRPYKEAFSLDESLEILKSDAGSHFEPQFISKFEQIAKELYIEISNLENERVLNEHLDSLISIYFTILN
ncbi:MAG: HD domain-containing protein [Deltaproteobacteria bacterium]|nr:HD domain-containing protein [Deltaproteobacteria bacterium]